LIILYEIVHVLSDIGLQQKLYCFLPDAKPSKNARFGAGNPSAAFAPKKRKTPSEGLSLPVRLIWLAYVLPFQSNST